MKLVFIHGAGCTAGVFRAQVAAFHDAFAITLPGRAGVTGEPCTIAEFAVAVVRQLNELKRDDLMLCGSSMGGAIALELGLRAHPRVRGIVLIGCGAKLRVAPALFESLQGNFRAGARALAAMFFADATAELVDAAAAMMLEVGQAQTLRDFRACDAFDATGRLNELHLPLLALVGERDVLTPPKFARFVADRIPGAAARIVDGAGHLAMVERPDETNATLRAFVNQIENR